MASIVKRGRGYSVVYYVKTEGNQSKQKWEAYPTEKEAQQRKWEIETSGSFLGVPPRLYTLSDLITEYIECYGKSKWTYSTYTTRTSLINRYIVPQIGKVKLSVINSRLMSRYFSKLHKTKPMERKFNPARTEILTLPIIHDIYKLLRSVFNQAVIWGLYSDNPLTGVPVIKPISLPRDILTMAQIKYLVEVAEKQNKKLALAVQLAFAGSLRRGEILALCWNDVDFEGGFINVGKELVRISSESLGAVHGKRAFHVFSTAKATCTTHLVLKHPKTKASCRKVFLPESLMRALASWEKEQTHTFPLSKFNLIFKTEDGKPLQSGWLNKHFIQLLEECNLPRVVFHSLRHSSTTYKLLLSGGDIKSVQGDTGHTTSDMILNVYARIQDEQRKNMAQYMEEAFYE